MYFQFHSALPSAGNHSRSRTLSRRHPACGSRQMQKSRPGHFSSAYQPGFHFSDKDPSGKGKKGKEKKRTETSAGVKKKVEERHFLFMDSSR
jgi:hypothetical protein